MYEYRHLGTNETPFQGGTVLSLQRAILENGCQLRLGADGSFGPDTEEGVRCLIGERGRSFILQSWPWVAERMTLPPEQADEPVPWWFSWAAAGVAFVSIVAASSILTRGR